MPACLATKSTWALACTWVSDTATCSFIKWFITGSASPHQRCPSGAAVKWQGRCLSLPLPACAAAVSLLPPPPLPGVAAGEEGGRGVGPGGAGSSAGQALWLYRLYRGVTPAAIRGIAFAPDASWVAVSSGRGTTHVFHTPTLAPGAGDSHCLALGWSSDASVLVGLFGWVTQKKNSPARLRALVAWDGGLAASRAISHVPADETAEHRLMPAAAADE